MTIERRRPLPVGRYWIDVFASKRVSWEAWRNTFVPAKATIEHTEDFEADGANEARQFVIFSVIEPVVWPDADMQIGVNVAPATIRSSADTAVAPEPEPLLPGIDSFQKKLTTGLVIAVSVSVGATLLIAFAKFRKSIK